MEEEQQLNHKNNCQVLWDEVIQPSIIARNPVNYHGCCNTITTRTLTEKGEHPKKETISEFLKRNGITNANDFYEWFIKDTEFHLNSHLPVYYLTINTKHHSPGTEKPYIKTNDFENEYWKKRLEFMEDRLIMTSCKVSNLEGTIEELKNKINNSKSKPETIPSPDSSLKKRPPQKSEQKLKQA